MAKEEKVKEIPWTEQKLMYKDGNVDVFRKFNWETWKRMTADERAMWTELNENTPAPISKEVIEFNKKETKKSTVLVDVINKQSEQEAEETLSEIQALEIRRGLNEIEAVRAELKERGIKFAYNSKLATLKKKLADADNPE